MIPDSGTVPVTVAGAEDMRRFTCVDVTIAGVEGVLDRDISLVGNWTFTRDAPGEPVAVSPDAPVQTDASAYADEMGFIWAGRNNISDPDRVISDIALMVDHHYSLSDAPMWVVSMTPNNFEEYGTSDRQVLEYINDSLEESYGQYYIPLDDYLRDEALLDMGITPTAQDRANHDRGLLPSSLLAADQFHLNDLGRTAASRYIAGIILNPDDDSRRDFGPIADLSVSNPQDGILAVMGWGFDRSDIGTSLQATIRIDGRYTTSTTANLSSPYLHPYGVWGNHAFFNGFNVEPGTHEVCVTFENLNAGSDRTICRTISVGGAPQTLNNPQGDYSISSNESNGVTTVMGWGFDHSHLYSQIDVVVNVDGVDYSTRAALPSPYLRPYGVPGDHAFFSAFVLNSGRHTVCVTLRDIAPGSDTSLGCRTFDLNVATENPEGWGSARMAGSTMVLEGIAFDPSATTQSLTIDYTTNGQVRARSWANQPSPELYPYGVFGAHRFTDYYNISTFSRGELCATARNIGRGSDTTLQCWHVDAYAGSPIASLAVEQNRVGGLQVSGWAIDLSLQEAAVPVTITVDGVQLDSQPASGVRRELMTLFNWHGDHGYVANMSVNPSIPHNVCMTAQNIGPTAAATTVCVQYEPYTYTP